MEIAAKCSADIAWDTKKYIIAAARRFFSEYGYSDVSMSDIAKKLNITKAALYYHFTGKSEIYQKVLDEVFNDFSLSMSGIASESTGAKKLHRLIKNYLDFGVGEKNLIKALVVRLSPADSSVTRHIIKLRGRILDAIQPIIAEFSDDKKTRMKVDSRFLASMLASMMDGLLLEYSLLNKKIDSKKVSDQIIAVLF